MINNFTYKDLYFKGSVDKQLKIEVDNGLVIDNTMLFEDEFLFEESLCSQESLVFGSCEANSVKFTIANEVNELIGRYITIKQYIGGYTDDYMQIGVFKVVEDRPTADRMRREIVAYDKMYDIINTDCTEWYNGLAFPMTLLQFRNAFFDYLGVSQKGADLINDGIAVEKTIEAQEISGKDVITAICEINGCFGNINRFGQFRYVSLETISYGVYPKLTLYPMNSLYPQIKSTDVVQTDVGKYVTCEYENWKTDVITGLKILSKENDIGVSVGSDSNAYTITGNFLVYGKDSFVLEQIASNVLDVIKKAIYMPFTSECVGFPCAQIGDAIRIITNKEEVIEAYILNRSLRGIQGLYDTYSAKGTKSVKEAVNGADNKFRQLLGKSNVLEREIEYTKSRIEDVSEGLSAEIEQTASSIRAELKNDVDGLNTTIETTASGIQTQINSIQTQLDGNIVTFSGDYIPTLENEPAIHWTTDELKDKHIGNIFYYAKTVEGEVESNSYRFQKVDGVYKWEVITDSIATKAMEDATKALSEIVGINNNLSVNYWNKEETQSNIDASADSIRTEVSGTYATVASVEGLSQIYATQTQLESAISQTDREIDLSVAGSKWMSGSTSYDFKGNGFPTIEPGADNVGKKYLDVDSGRVYQCSLTDKVYSWVVVGELKSTEASINLALDPVNMTSSISAYADNIDFVGKTMTIDSENFTLDRYGNATFSGDVESATIVGCEIVGGKINIGDGNFAVNTQGDVFLGREIYFNQGGALYSNNGLLQSNIAFYAPTMYSSVFYGALSGNASSASFATSADSAGATANAYGGVTISSAPALIPSAGANYMNCGGSSYYWKDVNSAHYTTKSDRKLKKDISSFDDKDEAIFNNLKPVKYKLKQNESDRTHFGFIAQEVEEAIEKAGLTTKDCAVFCRAEETQIVDGKEEVVKDKKGNIEYTCSLRYEELIALNTHMIQMQAKKIEELEKRIETLEKALK